MGRYINVEFYLDEGNPSQNGMKFCCGCGKKLVEHEWEDILTKLEEQQCEVVTECFASSNEDGVIVVSIPVGGNRNKTYKVTVSKC